MTIRSVNPATEEVLEEFPPHTDRQLESILAQSQAAFKAQVAATFAQRADNMNRAADILEEEVDTFAMTLTREMGKTIVSARAEVEKCAWVCRYYAEHAEALLADRQVQTDASRSFKRYLPIGPVLAVMPWNFPFWQVFRFAAPALMAGSTGILKHASNVPRSRIGLRFTVSERQQTVLASLA